MRFNWNFTVTSLRLYFHKTDSKAKMTRYLDLWSRHLNLFSGYLVQFTSDNMTRHADSITSNHIHLLNRHHNFMSWHFDLLKPNILILYSTLTNHYYFFFITLSIYFTTLKKAGFFWVFFFYWKVKCNIQWVADFLLSIWVFLVRLWSFFYHSADEKEFVQRRWLYRSPKHNELSH